MTRHALATFVAASSLVASGAGALDQPLDGVKLLVKRTPSGAEKLVFVSRDPDALFPGIGSSNDPSLGGAYVSLFSLAEPAGALLWVPSGTGPPGWSVRDATVDAFRFGNPTAPNTFSSVKVVVLKQGHALKVVARETGLALAGPQGGVGIRVTTGSLRSCAFFGAGTARTDEPGTFLARDASAATIADCSDATLAGAVCGDSVVSPPFETCDGATTTCSGFASCRPPGISQACTCCEGNFTQVYGCCNPSSILIIGFGLQGSCLNFRCDPPFDCNPGYDCLPDGSCCAPLGQTCLSVIPYPIPTPLGFPCCPGLECRGPSTAAVACCIPDAGTCTADADCCSQHCTASTCDACRGGGGACSSIWECCSLSCTSGTCDACAPAGVNCLDGSTCCSGSCTGFVCDP